MSGAYECVLTVTQRNLMLSWPLFNYKVYLDHVKELIPEEDMGPVEVFPISDSRSNAQHVS